MHPRMIYPLQPRSLRAPIFAAATPPSEMIERQPYLPRWMAGGPGNPLGARAMYIGNTVYRIHGTNAPETIGHALSSGCFRLVNSEIEDLYARAPVGAKVIVRH